MRIGIRLEGKGGVSDFLHGGPASVEFILRVVGGLRDL